MARLMGMLADRLSAGDPVSDHLLGWPGDPSVHADSVPLRLAGALHALRLEGLALADVYPPNDVSDDALWDAVSTVMRDHASRILQWLESAPQTNEVRRAAMILPALAWLNERFQRPTALFELGASGGLNLRADLFRLDAGERVLGAEESDVTLEPDWRGSPPVGELPVIVHRSGVDLNPLDPLSAEGRLRLLAYLWPDQPERLARTEAAISLAQRAPAALDTEDAGAWLAEALSQPMPGVMRVVFHTVAWQYFPPETRRRAVRAIAQAGASATSSSPLARISVEGDGGRGAAITVTAWPGGDTVAMGRADFHGRWVDWHPGMS